MEPQLGGSRRNYYGFMRKWMDEFYELKEAMETHEYIYLWNKWVFGTWEQDNEE
jgi:hypothetical protein